MELHFERPTAATTIAVQVQGGESFSAGTILPSSDAVSVRHDDIPLLTTASFFRPKWPTARMQLICIFNSVQEC